VCLTRGENIVGHRLALGGRSSRGGDLENSINTLAAGVQGKRKSNGMPGERVDTRWGGRIRKKNTSGENR